MPRGFAFAPFLKRHGLPLAMAAHVVIALLLATGPETGDMPRYRIQAQTVLAGKNIYANYSFYNYGPVWMYLVAGLYSLSAAHFRMLVAAMLATGASAAAVPVARLYGREKAIAFLLAPLTLLATGWFSMFDVLALGIGVWGLLRWKPGAPDPADRRLALFSLVLGASLAVKHILAFYPLWIAFSVKGWRRKGIILLIPAAIFLLGFAPYWQTGAAAIKENVFRYEGMFNVPWVQAFTGAEWFESWSARSGPDERAVFRYFFYAVLAGMGWGVRKRPPAETFLLYTAIVVAASPTLHVYYTFIPVLFLLHGRRLWHVLFTASLLLFIALYHTGGQGGFGGRALLQGAAGTAADRYLNYWPTVAVIILFAALADALWVRRLRADV